MVIEYDKKKAVIYKDFIFVVKEYSLMCFYYMFKKSKSFQARKVDFLASLYYDNLNCFL